jgi:hypothetical protein
MESDLLGLHFAILNVDLVSAENNWDMFAHPNEITMPVGHVLVSETRSDIEHDDGSLTLNVIAVTQTTELLLNVQILSEEFFTEATLNVISGFEICRKHALLRHESIDDQLHSLNNSVG